MTLTQFRYLSKSVVTRKISYCVKPKFNNRSIVEFINLSSNRNQSVSALNFLFFFLSRGFSIPSSQHCLQERTFLCSFFSEEQIKCFFFFFKFPMEIIPNLSDFLIFRQKQVTTSMCKIFNS